MNADESRLTQDEEPRSGADIDIWGDGSPTRSTPIPVEWQEKIDDPSDRTDRSD
jgi:hypothetical protein